MKVTINTKTALSLAAALVKVVPSKAALPILESFLFNADEKGLSITASDGETSLKTVITDGPNCQVEAAGSAALPARLFLELLKEVPYETISLDTQPQTAIISWKGGKGQIPNFDPEDYPAIDFTLESAASFDIPTDELDKAIAATVDVAAIDPARPALGGINVEIDENGLSFAASDSHRLAWRDVPSVKGNKGSFILHARSARLIRSLYGDAEQATVLFNKDRASFVFGDTILSVRLITGRYPKWRDIVPKDNTNKLTVNRKEFINIIRRVSVCANKSSSQIKIDLKSDTMGGIMEITGQDLGFALAAYEKASVDYQGEPLTVGVKAPFLTELLNNLEGEEVTITLSDARRAMLISCTNESEGESFTRCILMPVMVQ